MSESRKNPLVHSLRMLRGILGVITLENIGQVSKWLSNGDERIRLEIEGILKEAIAEDLEAKKEEDEEKDDNRESKLISELLYGGEEPEYGRGESDTSDSVLGDDLFMPTSLRMGGDSVRSGLAVPELITSPRAQEEGGLDADGPLDQYLFALMRKMREGETKEGDCSGGGFGGSSLSGEGGDLD